jgi:hypothetical protein
MNTSGSKRATVANPSPNVAKTPPSNRPLSEKPATPHLPISSPATICNSSPRPLSHRRPNLLYLIQLAYQGHLLGAAWRHELVSAGEYQELQDALAADELLGSWVADKLRYDYDPYVNEITLRMPSLLHDIFAIRLQEVIAGKLGDLAKLEGVRTIISCIKTAATSDVQFGSASAKGKKSPDGSFRFSGAKHPPVVIEVANSQKRDDLLPLAESYTERTKGRIKTVIAIDLEYLPPNTRVTCPATRKAVYSVYRHRLTRDEMGFRLALAPRKAFPLFPSGSAHLLQGFHRKRDLQRRLCSPRIVYFHQPMK